LKKAIFLYDYTGLIAKPWLDAGYECWSFDGQHPEGITREGNYVKVGMWFYPDKTDQQAMDVFMLVGPNVVHVFGFPECKDLAVSGATHFKKKLAENPNVQINAANLAKLVEKVAHLYGCAWAAENPVSVLSTLWRAPDFYFNPFDYGGYLPKNDKHPEYPEYIKPRDAYPKKTCIWCGNGYKQPKKKPVEVESGYSQQHRKLGGKSLKTKNIRSATPRGFAIANFLANGESDVY